MENQTTNGSWLQRLINRFKSKSSYEIKDEHKTSFGYQTAKVYKDGVEIAHVSINLKKGHYDDPIKDKFLNIVKLLR